MIEFDKITEGVYFGLPEETYHRAEWVGSSNMKKLYASPPDYWFESHMNPLREPDEPTFAQTFGRAIHARILYGEETFRKTHALIEEDGETPSADGLKKWINSQGGVPQKLKADNERMVAEEWGISLLTRKNYQRIMVSAAQIVKNPHLAQAFVGGWPEVSVFWIQDGVPCKARFDYLKKRAIVDLKSFRSKDRIRTLDETVLQDLFNYRYDIQVAHYLNGHEAMGALVAAGKVFAAADRPDDAWLKAGAEKPGWVFVFYKADGMPLSKSYQIAHGSPAHECGKAAVRTALANYTDCMERFGTDAWVNLDPPFPIDEEDIPKWL